MNTDTETKPDNFYWDHNTNEAVDTFVDDKSLSLRELDRLYTKKLYPTIDKMIKAIIHRYNFYETGLTIPDLVSETHVKAYNVLSKSRKHEDKYYDPSQNASFFYFTTVIKRFLINLQRDEQQRVKKLSDKDVYMLGDPVPDKDFDALYFLDQYRNWVLNNYQRLFTNPVDLEISEVFLNIIEKDPEAITSIRGLSNVIFERIDMDEDYFYDRWYKTKTILNKIYIELRNKYDAGMDTNPSVDLNIRRRY